MTLALIGHYFNPQKGGYSLFEVDELKETEKQYQKTKGETVDGAPEQSYDYWNVLRKSDLGELRHLSQGNFIMYAVQEDMPRFRELIIAFLEWQTAQRKESYEKTAQWLESARNGEDIKG